MTYDGTCMNFGFIVSALTSADIHFILLLRYELMASQDTGGVQGFSFILSLVRVWILSFVTWLGWFLFRVGGLLILIIAFTY